MRIDLPIDSMYRKHTDTQSARGKSIQNDDTDQITTQVNVFYLQGVSSTHVAHIERLHFNFILGIKS